MQIKDVWVITSDDDTELYDDEQEAVVRAFEMIAHQDVSNIVDWFESLNLEEQKKIFYMLQAFDHRNTHVEKV